MSVAQITTFRLSVIMLVCLPNFGPASFAQTPNKEFKSANDNWQSIFDGKSLNGWLASEPNRFSIEDGAITGTVIRQHNGPVQRVVVQTGSNIEEQPRTATPFLVWQGGKLADFRLRFKCRLSGGVAHAGVYFRGQLNNQELTGGYQVDIPEDGFFEGVLGKRPFENYAQAGESNLVNPQGVKTVTYFGEKQKLLAGTNFGQWTEYEIFALGPHIVLTINGRKIAELIDQSKEAQAGVLAIALYPLGEMKVQIKDIQVQPLPRNAAATEETVKVVENIKLVATIKSDLDTRSAQKALALLKQHPELVNMMVGMRTNATSPGGTQETFLLLASQRGHLEVAKWLIANGANVNQQCYNQFLPIHLAANAEIAKLLLAAGADLQAIAVDHKTPMQMAAQDRRLEVVEAIIESGVKIDLISAIFMWRSDLAKKLIENNPTIVNKPLMTEEERRYQRQETPLMIAVRQGQNEMVELLLNAGAAVNEKYQLMFATGPPHCMTVSALSIAVVHRKPHLVELLLHHGANSKMDCNASSFSPSKSILDYAREYGTPEIVALLEKEWPQKKQ